MISIIIPTYKSPEYLDLCLESAIVGQDDNNQIIVVVDGYYNLNKEVLEKWKVKEQRIRTTSNVESVLMTPLQSLTDIVRSISVEQDNKTYESGEAPLVP